MQKQGGCQACVTLIVNWGTDQEPSQGYFTITRQLFSLVAGGGGGGGGGTTRPCMLSFRTM